MDAKGRVWCLLYAALALGRKVERGGEVTEEDLDALRFWAARLEAEDSKAGDVEEGVREFIGDRPWEELAKASG